MSQPAGRGRRSRIVIDVEQARAAAQARGRRGRRALPVAALVAAGVVLAALAGAYLWWQSYKKGPAYSLALLVDASRRDDLAEVETLVDADAVAQGFVPQVIEKLTGAGADLPPEARARVTAALPQLLPRVRETVREEVARGVKAAAAGAGDTSFLLLALGIPRAADIREGGDAATAVFEREGKRTELSLRRGGERWKVVGVKDDELASDIAQRLAASIPQGPPPQTNQPRRRQGR